VKALFEQIAPQCRDRSGGYTRIVKLGVRGATMRPWRFWNGSALHRWIKEKLRQPSRTKRSRAQSSERLEAPLRRNCHMPFYCDMEAVKRPAIDARGMACLSTDMRRQNSRGKKKAACWMPPASRLCSSSFAIWDCSFDGGEVLTASAVPRRAAGSAQQGARGGGLNLKLSIPSPSSCDGASSANN